MARANNPCLREFLRELLFPRSVVGPGENWALRRFDSRLRAVHCLTMPRSADFEGTRKMRPGAGLFLRGNVSRSFSASGVSSDSSGSSSTSPDSLIVQLPDSPGLQSGEVSAR